MLPENKGVILYVLKNEGYMGKIEFNFHSTSFESKYFPFFNKIDMNCKLFNYLQGKFVENDKTYEISLFGKSSE